MEAPMRRIFNVVLTLLLLIALAVWLLPYFIPSTLFRDQIQAALESNTGRKVTVGEDAGLSVFPQLKLRLTDVTISNVEGAKEPIMASIKELDVGLAIAPLLRSEIEITKFVLVDPTLRFEFDKNGKSNWEFEVEPQETVEQNQSATEDAGGDPQQGETTEGQINAIRFGDIRLENGHVFYDNKQTGDKYTAEQISVAVSLPDLESALAVDGSLIWQGQKVDLDLEIENLGSITANKKSPISVAIQSTPIDLTFSGEIGGANGAMANGEINASGPSLGGLLEWVGSGAPNDALGAFALKGNIEAIGDIIKFADARINLNKMTGRGDISVNSAGARPFVAANLDVDRLDATPFLEGTNQGSQNDGGASSTASSQAAKSPTNQSSPTRSAASNTGQRWSTERLDLSGLKSIDADLAFNAGQILYGDLKFQNADLDVKIRNGVMTANLKQLDLYEGSGVSTVVVNAQSATPTINAKLTADAVDALPFFSDAIGFGRLEGLGDLSLDLSMRGRSQQELMNSLTGTGKLDFEDGAIRGVNLAEMVRNIQSAFKDGGGAGQLKTDFAQFGGTFSIQNGVLTNTDLALLSPFLRLTGNGAVNIAQQTVSYRITPKAVKSTEGQGGALDLSGVTVPILVTGSWDRLTFAPDLVGLIGGAISGSQGDSANDPLGGLIRGVLGLPEPEPSQEGQEPTTEATPDINGDDEAATSNQDGGAQEEQQAPLDPFEILRRSLEGR
jgi:AsmA protein